MHEDDVTFTRILGPFDAESGSGRVPAREHPAIVWRTSAGDEQVFELEHRVLRIGRHDQNDVMLAGPHRVRRRRTCSPSAG